MKSLWTAVVAAFSTFSVFPTPRIEWDEFSLKNVLAALPLVGAAVGGFLCLYFWLSGLLELPAILSAVVFTILPVALSGGIHMDGFADTVDALSSHAEPEKKRAILKDPHCGAFAVICFRTSDSARRCRLTGKRSGFSASRTCSPVRSARF